MHPSSPDLMAWVIPQEGQCHLFHAHTHSHSHSHSHFYWKHLELKFLLLLQQRNTRRYLLRRRFCSQLSIVHLEADQYAPADPFTVLFTRPPPPPSSFPRPRSKLLLSSLSLRSCLRKDCKLTKLSVSASIFLAFKRDPIRCPTSKFTASGVACSRPVQKQRAQP